MDKFKTTIIALLTAIALEGAVMVHEVRRIARDGFNMELSFEQAEELVDEVQKAKEAAEKDMEDESYE